VSDARTLHDPIPAAVTADLLRRYDRPGPRYTSYPTALEFNATFGPEQYEERLRLAAQHPELPLSLYAHLPFCESRCSFCACTVLITRNHGVGDKYLGYILREIDAVAPLLGERRRVAQLHWGGGTPTFFDEESLELLFAKFKERFDLLPDAEIAIEVDPRVTSMTQMATLRRLGFNRVSMGVQDFDGAVQEAIHRIQPLDATRDLILEARRLGFESVNLDLVYGLPRQTEEGFLRTLDAVVALRPDRLAVYSFAVVPWMKRNQRLIRMEELPATEVKLRLFGHAREVLLRAGYRAIGMDHFALPGDELSLAADARTLHRNFMGYATRPAPDMIGFGMSAIGEVAGAFVQNHKSLTRYYEHLDAGRLPVERGLVLDVDDERRRAVILSLMCNCHLDIAAWERRFGESFADVFARELVELGAPDGPAAHGFVVLSRDALEVTPAGALFVRNVAMVFDRRTRERRVDGPAFSRTV
jgi:oxygen-independent coproporphyrinogen-3 oxidase